MKERVVVAMSGGVDSSVAAALLKKQGFEVIGITMCFNLKDSVGRRPSCCGIQGIEDARRVAHRLQIRHYVLNMQKALEESVINNFCEEYLRGRTPNPCIRCNQHLKFGALLKKALSFDTKFLATGHYAQITGPDKKSRGFFLNKALDKNKDQSYFLYRVSQKELKHLLFPLGRYTKDKVRALAKGFCLEVADKLASQEVCFLPEEDYRRFLNSRIKTSIMPGEVADGSGKILGVHKGIPFYTIGQREGLGIALGYPAYVTDINPVTNKITIGRKEEVLKSRFLVGDTHFIFKPLKKKIALKVKIRYNHRESLANITPLRNKLKIEFLTPQFAITCGQSAVFYDRNSVAGGGIIEKVID